MKKILLATTLLAATTGFAAAEITLSGDARMGVIDDFGSSDFTFTSRARVEFKLSGETDGGLAYGAAFRSDNSASSTSGTAGYVFVSGAFGKLSMGDVDGAALAATGQVSGVGLTGLSDKNEILYVANGGYNDPTDGGTDSVLTGDPSALYEYSTGDFGFYLSASKPGYGTTGAIFEEITGQAYGLGMKYGMGDYSVGIGFEQLNVDATDTGLGFDGEIVDIRHLTLGGSATFGALTFKAVYGMVEGDVNTDTLGSVNIDGDQWAISADYGMDELTLTAFYKDSSDLAGLGGSEAWGLGASYDLGDGVKVVGGYASDLTTDEDAFDAGISFSF